VADKCNYRDSSGAYPCGRPRDVEGYCYFHSDRNLQLRAADTEFEKKLRGLVEAKDGDWRGFVLQRDLTLRDIEFSFALNLSGARVGALSLIQCKFADDVHLTQIACTGDVTFNSCEFQKNIYCEKSRFSGEFTWTSRVAGKARFPQCHFMKPARILGQFNGDSAWNNSEFFDSVEFRGGWIAYMSVGDKTSAKVPFESRPLFGGETNLSSIDFHRPDRARLVKVNLSRAHVRDTYFRGVLMHDITWASVRGRRTIYDEVWDRETTAHHAPMLPVIEAAYRTIRVSIEDGKDFATASDFYFGEMDARRKQMPALRRYFFSVEALYWLLSGYGTKPVRAFLWLLAWIGVHALITGAVLYGAGLHLPDPDLAANAVERTLKLLSPLRGSGDAPSLRSWWFLVDFAIGAFAVTQTALFALALRARIKRG
jgi:hypothetical protein